MSDASPVSPTVKAIGYVLVALAAFFWFLSIVGHIGLGASDAAGNAMASGFAALSLIALYVVLGALALLAALGGAAPPAGRGILVALVVVGAAISFPASDFLERSFLPPGHWPLLILVEAPAPIVGLSLWALTSLRNRLAQRAAYGLACGLMGLLVTSLAPMSMARDAEVRRQEQQKAEIEGDYSRLPPDAPLWEVLPFLGAGDYQVHEKAMARILASPRRQGDVEAMLDRDQFSFSALNQFDLDATPSLCEKARASLLRAAARIAATPAPGARDEAALAEVDSASAGMRWLVAMDCSCDDQARAFEDIARTRGADPYTLTRFEDLRNPAELGLERYAQPRYFWQLGPKTTLMGWVRYATRPGTPPEEATAAITGARKLQTRTPDAVRWLTDRRFESDRFELMRVWPDLDLDATPAICSNGLAYVRGGLSQIYRPGPDDPRPFGELIQRFGVDAPLERLFWFAEHGCDADAAIGEAETLVRAYQDGPDREAMLARLAAAKRGP